MEDTYREYPIVSGSGRLQQKGPTCRTARAAEFERESVTLSTQSSQANKDVEKSNSADVRSELYCALHDHVWKWFSKQLFAHGSMKRARATPPQQGVDPANGEDELASQRKKKAYHKGAIYRMEFWSAALIMSLSSLLDPLGIPANLVLSKYWDRRLESCSNCELLH
eukprot:6188628-Pleurochrysis_carterae.AAC.2